VRQGPFPAGNPQVTAPPRAGDRSVVGAAS